MLAVADPANRHWVIGGALALVAHVGAGSVLLTSGGEATIQVQFQRTIHKDFDVG